jgi:hypothetical protein
MGTKCCRSKKAAPSEECSFVLILKAVSLIRSNFPPKGTGFYLSVVGCRRNKPGFGVGLEVLEPPALDLI